METQATYRIGPSDFFTSGDLEEDAKAVDAQVKALDGRIEGNEAVPGDFVDGWHLFTLQWQSFYDDKFVGFFTFLVALNDSNRDQLVSFERQLAVWQQQAAAYGARPPGPTIGPSEGSGDSLKNHLPKLPDTAAFGAGLLTIVVVAALVYYFVVVRKGA